jgi:hypothetical protein
VIKRKEEEKKKEKKKQQTMVNKMLYRFQVIWRVSNSCFTSGTRRVILVKSEERKIL